MAFFVILHKDHLQQTKRTMQKLQPFVVFEGIACSGKSTQAKVLATTLRRRGVDALLHQEPTDRFFGKLVREIISNDKEPQVSYPALFDASGNATFTLRQWQDVVVPLFNPIFEKLKFSQIDLSEEDIQVLFMLDRLDNLMSILRPKLSAGKTIVQDRYHLSTLAHGATGKVSKERLQSLESEIYGEVFVPPAFTVFVRVSPEVARRRLEKRGDVARYDTEDRMQALDVVYAELIEEYRAVPRYGQIVVVNGEQSVEDVARDVWRHFARLAAKPS